MRHMRLGASVLTLLMLLVASAAAWTDILVNTDAVIGPRNETAITINRYFSGDPLNIVVAYNDLYHPLGISYSPDSGYTWYDVQLDSVWSWTGDPSIACDPVGDLYACFLSYEGTWFYGVSGIYVCKSTDGGRTWGTPSTVDELKYIGGPPVKFTDKCMMTVDTNMGSPYVGNVYVGWQRDDTNGTNSDLFFSRSTDGGLNFDTPIQINDNPPQTAWAEGALPFVGATGNVYVTWYDCYFKGGVPGSLYVDISYNGGQTFGTDIKVASFLAPPLYTYACTGFKAKCFPSAAADPYDPDKLYITYISDPDGYADIRIDVGDNPGQSPSNMPVVVKNGNYVYSAWQDYRNGFTGSDIYFNRSTDNGVTWEIAAIGPLDNTDTPGANNSWMQQLAYSGSSVYCIWEDYRSTMGNATIWVNHSTDYGKTWQTEQNLDLSPTILSERPSIAATGSNVYAAWSDFSNGSPDIFFSRSTNNGTSWSAPFRIDNGDAPGQFISFSPRLACTGTFVYCMWIDDRTGTMQPFFNYSTNSGANWQSSSTMLSAGTATWTTFPNSGGLECTGSFVYACWTDDRSGVDEVYFNRSLNSGMTWVGDVAINDPGFMCAMPDLNILGNNVYIAWQDNRMVGGFVQPDIFFDYSTDNGATWQMPDIGPIDVGSVGIQSIAPDIQSDVGYVYATWYDERFGPGNGQIFFSRSTDNGFTWGSEVHINPGTSPFGLQSNTPVMAASNGWVNILWPDPRCVYLGMGQPDIFSNYSSDNGATWLNGPDEADVFCVKSTDAGLTWETPVRVNDDPGTLADVLPWVAVKSNGTVDIAWYHFRMSPVDPIAPGAEVRLTYSTDNASTFGPSFAVQDTIVMPTTQWVGEYIGVGVIDSFAYTVFTDNMQTGMSDIFIDRSVNPTVQCPCGDANSSGSVDIDDVVFLIGYIFSGGPPPSPLLIADANCSGGVDIDDVVYLIGYIFSSGNDPCDPDGDGVPDC